MTAVFLSAAAALATEIAIVRLGAPYVGQSLLPWSAAIASVLIGLMAGHALGGIVGGANADTLKLRVILAAAWCSGGIAALAMPLAVAAMTQRGWFDDAGSPSLAPLAVAALALPPSLAAGCVAPLVIRIAIAIHVNLPRVVARTYAASAAGSVAGTAAAGFLLLEWMGSHGLVLAIAALWLALAAFALPWRDMSARAAGWTVAITIAVAALIVLAGGSGPCQWESRYTCLRLIDRDLPGGGLARLMLLDAGVHSASDRDNPQRLHLGYAAMVDRLAAAAFAPSASPHALVIGGGGATLPRAWAQAPRPADVAVVELDGMVADAAASKMWAAPGPRLVTIVGDGRAALRAAAPDARHDVILMDAYRTSSVPPHLVTREFHQLARAHLAPAGVFIANVIDRQKAPQLALSVAATLALDFPAVDIWFAERSADAPALSNVVVAAWRDPAIALRPPSLTLAVTVMRAGEPPARTEVPWRRVDVRAAHQVWAGLCATILTDDHAPVDRLLAGRVHCKNP